MPDGLRLGFPKKPDKFVASEPTPVVAEPVFVIRIDALKACPSSDASSLGGPALLVAIASWTKPEKSKLKRLDALAGLAAGSNKPTNAMSIKNRRWVLHMAKSPVDRWLFQNRAGRKSISGCKKGGIDFEESPLAADPATSGRRIHTRSAGLFETVNLLRTRVKSLQAVDDAKPCDDRGLVC
jgi:hypothetical protein